MNNMDIGINIDTKQIENILSEQKQRQVIRNATNKLAALCRTNIRRSISSMYNINYGDVKIRLTPATNSRLYAVLRGSGSNISLMKFFENADLEKGGGVYVQVKRGNKQFIQSGFVQSPNGKRVILQREGGAVRYPLAKMPEDVLLSVGRVMASNTVQQRIKALINDNAPRLFEGELNYALYGKRRV
jgi:hypothetical protein